MYIEDLESVQKDKLKIQLTQISENAPAETRHKSCQMSLDTALCIWLYALYFPDRLITNSVPISAPLFWNASASYSLS